MSSQLTTLLCLCIGWPWPMVRNPEEVQMPGGGGDGDLASGEACPLLRHHHEAVMNEGGRWSLFDG